MKIVFGGLIATAIAAGFAWYFSSDVGINVPWSDKRIYHYDQCVKFENKWHVCETNKVKFAEYEKKLAELEEQFKEVKTPGERADYVVNKFFLESTIRDEAYYDCKDVWLEQSQSPSYPSRYELSLRSNYEPLADFIEQQCFKMEPKILSVTIDVENQVVWEHDDNNGLEKYECEVLDKNNYKCPAISLNVVNGKPIDMGYKYYK